MGWGLGPDHRDPLFAPGIVRYPATNTRGKSLSSACKPDMWFMDGQGWMRTKCHQQSSSSMVVARAALAMVPPNARIAVFFDRPSCMFQAREAVRAKRSAPVKNVRRARDKLDAYIASCKHPVIDRNLSGKMKRLLAEEAKWLKDTAGWFKEAFKQKLPEVYAHARECNDRRTALQNRIDPTFARLVNKTPATHPLPIGWQDAFDRPIVKPAAVRALRTGLLWWIRNGYDETLCGGEPRVIVIGPDKGEVWKWPVVPSAPNEVEAPPRTAVEAAWAAALADAEVSRYGEGEMSAFSAIRAAAKVPEADVERAAKRVRTDPAATKLVGAPAGSLTAMYVSGDTDAVVQWLGADIAATVRLFVLYANVKVEPMTGTVYRGSKKRVAPSSAQVMCEAVDLAPCFGVACLERPAHLVMACTLVASGDYWAGLGNFGFFRAPMLKRMQDPDAPTMVAAVQGGGIAVDVTAVKRFLRPVKRSKRNDKKVDEFVEEIRKSIFSTAYFCGVFAGRERAGPVYEQDIELVSTNGTSTVTEWLHFETGDVIVVGP